MISDDVPRLHLIKHFLEVLRAERLPSEVIKTSPARPEDDLLFVKVMRVNDRNVNKTTMCTPSGIGFLMEAYGKKINREISFRTAAGSAFLQVLQVIMDGELDSAPEVDVELTPRQVLPNQLLRTTAELRQAKATHLQAHQDNESLMEFQNCKIRNVALTCEQLINKRAMEGQKIKELDEKCPFLVAPGRKHVLKAAELYAKYHDKPPITESPHTALALLGMDAVVSGCLTTDLFWWDFISPQGQGRNQVLSPEDWDSNFILLSSKTQIMRRSKAPEVMRLDAERLDSIAKEFHKVQALIGKRRLVGAIPFHETDTGVATVLRSNGRVKGTIDCGSGLNKQIAGYEDVNIAKCVFARK
ncbi:hypothetical protein DFS34DRAFT_596171 [Phlyctochytrium arcticum]|nr:hypothetical protein DFS34DRAFT_596171 [Phlyctochytrium arcticum]